ncbi:hypothetical protein M427DRAFT_76193 [Gonapodya prolifera JEL478]|uniref:UBP-type domain-containing protein n=1 Tax=Gonapodya prolifera (strain JEL478) TaxID=1344416 RepID=A0A138ZW94_GONPJ|nr:hypothetical protein M427DRAFT_76193 [Gonapodya prolifera JEL478]|eukprot:KXS08778.1 hypothetical protein M427DRAFT_76193 [Gonapodya prolifera JEL478]
MSDEDDQWFNIVPKLNCPHVHDAVFLRDSVSIALDVPCSVCTDTSENWICLSCYDVFCSRYVNSHMLSHFESSKLCGSSLSAASTSGSSGSATTATASTATADQTGHPHCVAASFTDLSFWCFECGEYIESDVLRPFHTALHVAKFDVLPGSDISTGGGPSLGANTGTDVPRDKVDGKRKARDT